MIGVVLENGEAVVRRNLPDPEPEGVQALIGMRLAGICGTDRAMLGGYAEFSGIMGHEFVGEVLKAPDFPDWVGKRVLVQSGCRLEAVARHGKQRRRLEDCGIPWIPEGAGDKGAYDLVVEATGNPKGFDAAFQMVRPEGVVVLKSSLSERISVDLSFVVVNEITVIGSRCGPLDRAVQWLAEGKIDPTDLIEACLPLQEAPAAFVRAAAPGAFKVLLNC